MRFLPMAALAASVLLTGCLRPENETGGPVSSVVLPPGAINGAGDPMTSAIFTGAAFFASPNPIVGRPAEAAQAIAQMEYVAAALPTDPRYTTVTAGDVNAFVQGRAEWRQALGIPPQAPPQQVINALYMAARAISYGQPAQAAAALVPPNFTLGGAETVARLANLPAMPLANRAGVYARGVLERQQRQGNGRF
jgi:hypothetical protein